MVTCPLDMIFLSSASFYTKIAGGFVVGSPGEKNRVPECVSTCISNSSNSGSGNVVGLLMISRFDGFIFYYWIAVQLPPITSATRRTKSIVVIKSESVIAINLLVFAQSQIESQNGESQIMFYKKQQTATLSVPLLVLFLDEEVERRCSQ